MSYTKELVDEVNMLNLFQLSNNQEGIKVHATAEQSSIDAAKRLFEKGLTTQKDGGYLTDLGIEAVEHVQALLLILTTEH